MASFHSWYCCSRLPAHLKHAAQGNRPDAVSHNFSRILQARVAFVPEPLLVCVPSLIEKKKKPACCHFFLLDVWSAEEVELTTTWELLSSFLLTSSPQSLSPPPTSVPGPQGRHQLPPGNRQLCSQVPTWAAVPTGPALKTGISRRTDQCASFSPRLSTVLGPQPPSVSVRRPNGCRNELAICQERV